MDEIVLRFAVGGAIVSTFALFGEVFQPKTFAGTFAAAPSVALATLTLAFRNKGAVYAATECRSMIIGAIALVGYGAVCVALTQRLALPVWLGAVACWLTWLAIAFGLFFAGGIPR
jgi:hypothetical protein